MQSTINKVLIGAALVGSISLGGVVPAVAQTNLSPANTGSENREAPVYPTNEKGLSYGSAAEAISRETEPDLIRVYGDNGGEGYVYADELDYQPDFKSPDEAMAWQNENGRKNVVLRLFASDGEQVSDILGIRDGLDVAKTMVKYPVPMPVEDHAEGPAIPGLRLLPQLLISTHT